MPSPLKVVVAGGGIGGLALAQALRRAGVDVTVHERDAGPAARAEQAGYRIHINPMGSSALHDCLPPALWELFVATSGDPGRGFGFLTERLEELVAVDDAMVSAGAADATLGHYAVSRTVLRQLLLAGLGDTVRFGQRLVGYERLRDGRVTARFEDGTTATGDVLVGADGAGSAVRRQYLPGARQVATGAVAIGGKLPLTDATRAWLPATLCTRLNTVFPKRHFLFTAIFDRRAARAAAARVAPSITAAGLDAGTLFGDERDADYVFWTVIAAAGAHPAGADRLDGPALRALAESMAAGWHPSLRRLISESDPATVRRFALRTSVRPAPWAPTNVTVLGDAIHSMSPVGGLGGNTALRDASRLASTLAAVARGEAPLVPAIGAYERAMLDHGFAAAGEALRNTRLAATTSPLVRAATRRWFRLCGAASPLKRLTFGEMTSNMLPRSVSGPGAGPGSGTGSVAAGGRG